MVLVPPTLATLRPGQQVDGVFACTRKDRLTARTGSPYLAVELRDRTGTVPARAFRDADVLAGRFDRGDLVRVRGRVERFRDELQVELADIAARRARRRRPGGVPSRRLPRPRRARRLPRALRAGGPRPAVRRAAERAARPTSRLRADWRRAPCTRDGHHAYLGGLLEHTVAVAQLAAETCQLHVRLNSDLLITAALVHDLGKTREFDYGAAITLTEEGRLLGHVELGLDLLRARAAGVLDAEHLLALSHCVLTHHGPDRAPARRFGSAEAVALYRLNALDASVKGVLEHGLG